MKKLVQFQDRFGKDLLGSDGAYFTNLKTRQGLLNEAKRRMNNNFKKDIIRFAIVTPVSEYINSSLIEQRPMYTFAM